FFSSRRRHTRFSRDWSSDVCSSDLVHECDFILGKSLVPYADVIKLALEMLVGRISIISPVIADGPVVPSLYEAKSPFFISCNSRSEERRVGRECGARGPQ